MWDRYCRLVAGQGAQRDQWERKWPGRGGVFLTLLSGSVLTPPGHLHCAEAGLTTLLDMARLRSCTASPSNLVSDNTLGALHTLAWLPSLATAAQCWLLWLLAEVLQ